MAKYWNIVQLSGHTNIATYIPSVVLSLQLLQLSFTYSENLFHICGLIFSTFRVYRRRARACGFIDFDWKRFWGMNYRNNCEQCPIWDNLADFLKFFKNCLFLAYVYSFKQHLTANNWSLWFESNSDRQSRRRACWPPQPNLTNVVKYCVHTICASIFGC